LGLSFTTLGTLMLELSLTRIFSVVYYPHVAFVAISIAMIGSGAGGVFSYFVASRRGHLYAKLGALALAASASVNVALLFVLFAPGDLGYFTLGLVCLAAALPFFFAGTVVSLALGEAMDRIGRAYFWDLAGAAAGCLLLVPFLHWFGGPNTVISAAVLYLVSAAIWFHQATLSGGGGVRRRVTSVLLALLLVMLMVANYKVHFIDVRTAKGRPLPQERFAAWNGFSRVSVAGDPGSQSILIDGVVATMISPFDWDRGITDQERRQLLRDPSGLPYILRPAAKTLVIGAGGGYDVARALAGGSRDVTVVENNPIVATTIMRDRFAAESHRIYFLPEVHVAPPQDGRTFVRASSEKYRVIQITLADSWPSMYTSGAFYDYLAHLTTGGLLSITRRGSDASLESLRLVSLATAAFARLGVADPASHMITVRAGVSGDAVDIVLISQSPFTSEDLERARGVGELLETPARDTSVQGNRRVSALFALIAVSIAATLLVLVLPRGLAGARLPGQQGVVAFWGYFLCLGAGYILIQAALIQRFSLLLGHPEYVLTVILFSMLLWSGLGSYASSSIVAGKDQALILVLAAISVLAAVLAVTAGQLIDTAAAWPIQAKLALSLISIAPGAFLMGMPFPCGLKRLERSHAPLVRWAWSVHSVAGVVGSAWAIVLAIYLGPQATVLMGGALYICALLVTLSTARKAASGQR
jgi:hypothetical protein